MDLLKSVLPVLTNQASQFISHYIVCPYFSENLRLSIFSRHDFEILVKSRGGGTFPSLAPPAKI